MRKQLFLNFGNASLLESVVDCMFSCLCFLCTDAKFKSVSCKSLLITGEFPFFFISDPSSMAFSNYLIQVRSFHRCPTFNFHLISCVPSPISLHDYLPVLMRSSPFEMLYKVQVFFLNFQINTTFTASFCICLFLYWFWN